MPSVGVLIMAQGRQSRLSKLGTPKQFLDVNGEPILGRTIRLLKDYGVVPDVVCWMDMAERVLELGAYPLVLDDPGRCILDGIDAVRESFGSKATIVLLGDVVYSRWALRRIWNESGTKDLFFAVSEDLDTGSGETFALAFRWHRNDFVRDMLSVVPCRKAHDDEKLPYQCGHLRNLLFCMQGARNMRPMPQRGYCEELSLVIDDWTSDIDTPEDVDTLLPELCEHAASE